jgi:hypothetical protein
VLADASYGCTVAMMMGHGFTNAVVIIRKAETRRAAAR